jgi:hypothetical protein
VFKARLVGNDRDLRERKGKVEVGSGGVDYFENSVRKQLPVK